MTRLLRLVARRIGCRLALVRCLRADLAILRADLAAANKIIAYQRELFRERSEDIAAHRRLAESVNGARAHRRPLHSFLNGSPPPAEFDPTAAREYIVRDFTPSPLVAELVASVNVAVTNDT